MADIYVRSTDGDNADTGATWALAKLDGAGAAAIDAAGDTINFSQVHAESTATAITWTLAGTAANPVRLLGVNDAAEPPTALSTTATITTTGASTITINGGCYVYGLTFNAGTGATAANIAMNNVAAMQQVYENCKFNLVNTGSTGAIVVTSTGSANTETIWKDCFVKFAATGQKITAGRGTFEWSGGGITSGGSNPTLLVGNAGSGGQSNVRLSGLDLSAAAATLNIFQGDNSGGGKFLIRNSKLPASWSGLLVSGTLNPGGRFELHNCDSADTNYRVWVEDYYGSIKHETTLVKTGGSSDGTTAYSFKMVSSANTTYPSGVLESIELPARWNSTVGSAITVTVDILRDSATNLTDAEIWLEVQYLGTSGVPLSSFISDAKADVFATAADQTASTATWTTTGMANPNKQKLAVTFTPQEVGFLQAKVMLAKASTTVYIDAKQQVS